MFLPVAGDVQALCFKEAFLDGKTFREIAPPVYLFADMSAIRTLRSIKAAALILCNWPGSACSAADAVAPFFSRLTVAGKQVDEVKHHRGGTPDLDAVHPAPVFLKKIPSRQRRTKCTKR